MLGRGTAILNVVVRMGLIEEITFDKSLQAEERASAKVVWSKYCKAI